MNRTLTLTFVAMFAVVFLASPSHAKEERFAVVAKSGSKKDKADAAKRVSRLAVEKVLAEEGLLGAIKGKKRDALVADCVSLVTDQKLNERRSKWRFTAKVDLDLVRAKAVAQAQGKGGKGAVKPLKLALAVQIRKKTGDDAKRLEAVVRAAVGEVLRKSGHELLQVDPKAAPEGVLVLTINLGLRYTPFAAGEPQAAAYQGRLRVMGTSYQVYDRATGSVRFRARLTSDKSRTELSQSDESKLAEPMVAKNETYDQVEEAYLEHAAQWIARGVVKRLNDQEAPRKSKRGAARAGSPSTYYQVRLKGYSEKEVAKFHKALKANKKVKNFKDVGKVKIFHIARMQILGDASKVVAAALKKARLKGKQSKTGNFLNVSK